MKKLKAISLFSGAGGDTLGMIKSGIDVIAFSENDKSCIETHKVNFKECEFIHNENNGDICKIPDNTWSKYKNIDIIFSGFPCQSFSNAGKKKSLDDSRGKMYLETIRVINITNPKIFILENVTGLLQRKIGDKKVFEDIMVKDFEKINYTLYYKILNGADFGLAQLRKRVFIVGVEKTIDKVFTFPDKNGIVTKVGTILENTLENSIKLINDISNLKVSYDNKDSEIPYGKVHSFLELNNNKNRISFGKRDSPDHGEIIDPDGFCKTIICSYSYQPRLYTSIKNNNGVYVRTLNINELKQIQGFPKNFILCGNDNQKIKQIGNAVPPILIEEICKKIKIFLEN